MARVKYVLSGEVRYFREWTTLVAFLQSVLFEVTGKDYYMPQFAKERMLMPVDIRKHEELEQQRHAMREKIYPEICANIKALDENSFKLLSFVPLVSGSAIIVVLLKGEAGLSWITLLLSLVGAAVTFGLYRWEFRNIQICNWLQECADEIERNEFGAEKGKEQFAIRMQRTPPKFDNPDYDSLHKLFGISIYQRTAEHIIYWTTIIGWLLLPLAVFLK